MTNALTYNFYKEITLKPKKSIKKIAWKLTTAKKLELMT